MQTVWAKIPIQHPEGAGMSNTVHGSQESSMPVESSSTADSLGFAAIHAVDTLNAGHTI